MGGAAEQFVFVKLHAREGEENSVEEALREVMGPSREVMGPSREEPGCISFHVFR
jgi:quinol monooxygenase YgiN